MRNSKTVTSLCSVIVKNTLSRQIASSSSWFSSSQASKNSPSTSMNNKRARLEAIRNEFFALGSPASSMVASENNSGTFNLHKDPESGIALLAIRNVNKKNCFSGSMMAQFTDFLNEVEQWKEGKALVLYGEKGFFSSGGDLDTVRQISNTEGGKKMITLMQENLARLQSLPLITVAYIEGMALGGGAELITACDYRLARENALLGFVQVRIGITTVWGGGARLVQLIGYNKALNLIATGRTFSGVEAAKMGFVDQLLPSVEAKLNNSQQDYSVSKHQEEVLTNVKQYLKPFLVLPRETMLVGKAVANEGRARLDDALENELVHGLKVWGGPVHQQALAGKVNHKKNT